MHTSTTSLVSPWTESLDLIGLNEPQHEILEQPEQYLSMRMRQRATGDGGGKGLSRRQRQLQPLQREETIRQHDQGEMPVQTIPASTLEVIQATFLFGIFVKLLDDPARMSQSDQLLKRGLERKRTEPVLRLLRLLLLCHFLLRSVVREPRLVAGEDSYPRAMLLAG